MKNATPLPTGDDIQRACSGQGINRIDHHECSLCGYMTNYQIAEGQVFFDAGCNCSWSGMQRRSFQDIADWINMQSDPDVRNRLLEKCGLIQAQNQG